MQTNLVQLTLRGSAVKLRPCCATTTLKSSPIGQIYQVRNHVKMYPWRSNRSNSECYLDNTRTPYTDKYNINEFKFSKTKLKPWQRVICKDKDNRFNKYKWFDSYQSDPREAKTTAHAKMQSLSDTLNSRGSAREQRPYTPPNDVQEKILAIYTDLYPGSVPATERRATSIDQNSVANTSSDLLSLNLNENRDLKFELISRCIDSFRHDMPSSFLNDVETIADVIDYFSTEVRGVNPYEHLVSNKDLPPNLSIIPDAHRFDKDDTDSPFKGYNAIPGTICKVPGLRAAKKYPILNQDEFQWPDI